MLKSTAKSSPPGIKINPKTDRVVVDGQNLDKASVNKIYVLMHKPRGYMVTLNDPEKRPTVMDLCQDVSERIYPVGRLDYLSEGLLVLTNDGTLANMIMHPRYNVVKVYEVKLFGAISDGLLNKLRQGLHLPEGFIKPLSVRVVQLLPKKTWLEIRIGEGKNREIRRLCEGCGLTVDKLRRVAIGNITVHGIPPGRYRLASRQELLLGLGLTKQGTLSPKKPVEYFSPKKSININDNKKVFQRTLPADDKNFYKFRREFYFQTMSKMKEDREKAEKLAKAPIKKDFKPPSNPNRDSR
ncbi:MAG: pseudouridine synthase [Pseudomonadota bacterium]